MSIKVMMSLNWNLERKHWVGFHKLVMSLSLVLIVGCWGPTAISEKNVKEMPGARLYREKECSSCHTISEGGWSEMGDPNLKGLFNRRKEAWVRKYIINSEELSKTDPTAIKLKRKYGRGMPNSDLTSSELDQLIGYLKEATR